VDAKSYRVAHICQSDDPNEGGALSVARALVRDQRKLGLDARLVFLYHAGATRDRPPGAADSLWCDVERSTRWVLGVRRLRRVLRSCGADLIHHHDGILWPRLATMTLGRPIVTHAHLGSPAHRSFFTATRLAQWVAMRTTNRLIAMSDWVAASWERDGFPTDRIRLIPNGVDTERFFPRTIGEKQALRRKLGLPVDCRMVVWVGRLSRVKGLDRVAAMASVLPPPLHLVVVGDGPDRSWLEARLKQVGTQASGYTFVGKVVDSSQYFGAADMFLFTSVAESFGMVLLEAAASGLPVFAFNCEGGAQELLKRFDATIVRDAEFGQMAELMAAPTRFDATETSKIVPAEFLSINTARRTVEVYQELLAPLPRPDP
jgi:glycosyltransferase involved in cell wall biosynthesis